MTDPKILAFDTSTAICTVALSMEGRIYCVEEIIPQRHAERILPMIKEILDEAKIQLSDLNAIAFGCGPGSFIGARIATGVAQSLAFAQDLPLISVSTLQTLAQTAYRKKGAQKIAAGWDARMQAIYWGLFEESNNLMQPVQKEQLSSPENISVTSDFFAAGNAWKEYREQLSRNFRANIFEDEIYPSAKSLLEIALDKFVRQEILAPTKAEPVYLRDDVAHRPKRN